VHVCTCECVCVCACVGVHVRVYARTHACTHALSLHQACMTCVLLCFIKPILRNCYVRSRGFIVSEPRETHPRSKIADVPTLTCPPLDRVSRSSPCTLTTSLATPVPSSSSSNGPSNYYVDNQGLVPWRLHPLGRSKVRSASLVKVLSHDKIS